MNAVLKRTVRNQTLVLHPERALYWEEAGMLIVADPHFGKPQMFRESGIPVPGGTTDEDLARLSALADRFQPKRLLFLGDVMHGPLYFRDDLERRIARWRERHRRLHLYLVTGNHDRRAGPPPEAFRFDDVSAAIVRGPFRFTHRPGADHRHYGIAGHLHPAVALIGKGRQKEILSCFCFGPRWAVLPAFGSFTGRHVVPPADDDHIYVVAGASVFKV